MNQNKLIGTIWWRLLKVIYIATWLFCGFIIIILALGNKPTTYVDDENSIINCTGGNSYKNKSTTTGYALIYSLDSLSHSDEQSLKMLCRTGQFISPYSNNWDNTINLPEERNFTLDFAYKTRGSWDTVVYNLLIGFLVVFAVIETIKTVILYILGISIWRGGLLYGLKFVLGIFSNGKYKSFHFYKS